MYGRPKPTLLTGFVVLQWTVRGVAIVRAGFAWVASNLVNAASILAFVFRGGTAQCIAGSCVVLLALLAANITMLYRAKSWQQQRLKQPARGALERVFVDITSSVYHLTARSRANILLLNKLKKKTFLKLIQLSSGHLPVETDSIAHVPNVYR